MSFVAGIGAGIAIGLSVGVAAGRRSAATAIESMCRERGLILQDENGKRIEIPHVMGDAFREADRRTRPALLFLVVLGVVLLAAGVVTFFLAS